MTMTTMVTIMIMMTMMAMTTMTTMWPCRHAGFFLWLARHRSQRLREITEGSFDWKPDVTFFLIIFDKAGLLAFEKRRRGSCIGRYCIGLLLWLFLTQPQGCAHERMMRNFPIDNTKKHRKNCEYCPGLLGWYQMILDVFRCSQQFSNVFRLFSNCFPTMFSNCWNPLQAELNYLWWVLSCSQDDIRWF